MARAVHRHRGMAIRRHVHHRGDGIIILCTRRRCAPSRWREIASGALLLALPFAVVAASIALRPRRFAIALAGLAAVAFLACRTRTLGARLEAGGAARPRRERARFTGTGSAA
jgi:hypothetical protein